MSTRDLIMMAVRNLWKRKLRTFLTILGVVIGTTSIVVMISIGIGMNESFQKQVEEWGSLQVIDVYSNNGDMYISSDANANRGKPQKKAVLDACPFSVLGRHVVRFPALSPALGWCCSSVPASCRTGNRLSPNTPCNCPRSHAHGRSIPIR